MDVPGSGYVRTDERVGGRELAAVQTVAHGPDFDQPVHNGEEAGYFSVEGEKRDVGNP